jgi:hypothetical protein
VSAVDAVEVADHDDRVATHACTVLLADLGRTRPRRPS